MSLCNWFWKPQILFSMARGIQYNSTTSITLDVTTRSTSSMIPPVPIRLCAVKGYDGRANDVIYCHPVIKTNSASVVVFFGGDMQDFSENMQSHRDSKNYLKWNLEDTTLLLQRKFPDSHFITIRPSRIEYKTISCYNNFVPSNNCGAPDHIPMSFALLHLDTILENVSKELQTMTEAELKESTKFYSSIAVRDDNDTEDNAIQTTDDLQLSGRSKTDIRPKLEESFWWRENIRLQNYEVSAIGFSKGCVVLNQFLYEFHYLKTLTPDDHAPMGIVSRIKDLYWLDGGHSGGRNTWITSRPLLETLARLGIRIHVHVTPYQIQDDRRPWIRKEEKTFSDLLKRLGAPIDRTVHFENVPPSLSTHFEVINTFKEDVSKGKSVIYAKS